MRKRKKKEVGRRGPAVIEAEKNIIRRLETRRKGFVVGRVASGASGGN